MDKPELNRRDFLKLAGMLPFSFQAQKILRNFQPSGSPNIFIIVFDAWSGHHLSSLGYPRITTPHLNKRLDQAIVYHNHYSAGNSTTPGTASLLTGTYPWTHRAFNHDAPAEHLLSHNLFNAVGSGYFSQMYTHNAVADTILRAFIDDADIYLPRQKLFLTSDWIDNLFGSDYDIASLSVEVIFKHLLNNNSLFLRDLYTALFERHRQRIVEAYAAEFPEKPPEVSGHHYLLETAINWLLENTPGRLQPFLSYFHFLPPHAPYQHTRAEFQNAYIGKKPGIPEKPEHRFSQGQVKSKMLSDRNEYDEYILYVDAEFERLFRQLEATGTLENTWVILTSDHGELFERGIIGHSTEAMFAPLLRVPLVLFGPGVTQRQDITTPTSSLDLLPTILQLTGQPVPDWAEGELLPGFRTSPPDPGRSIYAVNAKHNGKFEPITQASISMLKGNYRLSAYLGYEELDGQSRYELFDLENDPHELKDIFTSRKQVADGMVEELRAKLEAVNQPYQD